MGRPYSGMGSSFEARGRHVYNRLVCTQGRAGSKRWTCRVEPCSCHRCPFLVAASSPFYFPRRWWRAKRGRRYRGRHRGRRRISAQVLMSSHKAGNSVAVVS